MNTHKIFTYTALALGVIGLILQVVILSQGDDVIKLNALSGDYGIISTMVTLALLVLAITVVLTLVFSFGNLASDGEKLKKALISMGVFVAVVLVAFLFSMENVEWQVRVGLKRVMFESSGFYLLTSVYLFNKIQGK